MVDVVNTIEMLPIEQIKPYERNARKNEATVQKLIELLPKVGFNVPLVLDRNNVIVKGHARWKAARRLGMKVLPCVYTDADPETIKLDRLADNRVQEFSVWDNELLGVELASLNLDFQFNLGVLDFKLDAPPLDFSPSPTRPAEPPESGVPAGAAKVPEMADSAAREASDEAGEDNDVTAEDLAGIQDPEYLEVMCNKCGNRLYVKP
jgi:hypothetical protein